MLFRSSSHVDSDLKQGIVSSSPHYGHSGIVEAARNLFRQIEGNDDGAGKYVTIFSFKRYHKCMHYNVNFKKTS